MTIDRYDIVFVLLGMAILYAVLAWRKSLPSTDAIHFAVEMLNTKGGIILLLWITSMIFFAVGIKLVYWGVNMMLDNKLSGDNALILSAFNWITGAAFGGAFGAMIKTMTGEEVPKNRTSLTLDSTESQPTLTVNDTKPGEQK
jgi:uncharacterized membrane protein